MLIPILIIYHDLSGQPEKVYYAMVLGMLVWMSGKYDIRSNRGIILEFKKVFSEAEGSHEQVLKDALHQIDKKAYVTELAVAGIRDVLKIAVAFQGKELWVSHIIND